MNPAFAAVGLLLAAWATSAAPVGSVVHISYAERVGPVFVSGHGYVVRTPDGHCTGWGDSSMVVPESVDGARIYPTEERLSPCGHLRLWVYQEPMKGACDYACQTGHRWPFTPEEVKANWTLVAGPVDIE